MSWGRSEKGTQAVLSWRKGTLHNKKGCYLGTMGTSQTEGMVSTKEWMWEGPETSLAVRPERDDRGHARSARWHWIERASFQGKDSSEQQGLLG